jgi:dihydropteroate synthase
VLPGGGAAVSVSDPLTGSAPPLTLATARGELALGGVIKLMGIVNATPDSFSDAGARQSLEERVELAAGHLRDGADVIDIGGESGVTNRPVVEVAEEIERVVPLIERVAGLRTDPPPIVSVDTYKPEVARAAIAAGAAFVNDVSGLRDPDLAAVCAETGAGLVLMHTRAAPKQKLFDQSYDGRIVADVKQFLAQRIELALDQGMALGQLMLDPGPDFAKTPFQTVAVMRALRELHAFGRPLLLAVSRKDFVGVLTGRPPRQRLAGTLAALAHGIQAGAHMVRIHDVAAAADFVKVDAVLRGLVELDPAVRIDDSLRWEQEADSAGPTR